MEKREDKRRRMFDAVAAYEQGQESQELFCKRLGIGVHCFRYWISRYHAQQNEAGFVRITGNTELVVGAEIRMQYPNGVSLIFGADVDLATLKALIGMW